MGGDDTVTTSPVPVEIKNWADPIKPPFVKKTTLKTYILDVTNSTFQISDFEPKRYRMAIYAIDGDIAVTLNVPVESPGVSSPAIAPEGAHLPMSVDPHEFFGPDAMWINVLTDATRVTVIKEYC